MWNTLDVPLEFGWQCTLIPEAQYYDLTSWGRGYRNMSARALYPNAGRDNSSSWNARALSEVDKGELWEKDRLRQLADDAADFARHFRPNWDLRTNTGERALRDVQAFVRDCLSLAHWNLPIDNAALRTLLVDAVASGQLVPVVNREYRSVPRVAPPTHAPQRWQPTGGCGGYPPKVYSASEFDALRRANGELPALGSIESRVAGPSYQYPDLGVPARADDGFGLSGLIEAAVGAGSALVGSGFGSGDSDDGGEFDDGGGDDDVLPDLDSGDSSTPLGDAQPFTYSEDAPTGDTPDLAARGLSAAEEAECDDLYDRDMEACDFARAIYQDPRTYALCSQRAFSNYQSCRGY